jgi:hypothetical protein
MLAHPKPVEPLDQLIPERAVAADDQPPPRLALAEPCEHVGEQQGILLRLESADGENVQFARVVTAALAARSLDRRLVDQRDVHLQHCSGPPITALEVRPDDDDRIAASE